MVAVLPTLWFVIYCHACEQEKSIILRGKEMNEFVFHYNVPYRNAECYIRGSKNVRIYQTINGKIVTVPKDRPYWWSSG